MCLAGAICADAPWSPAAVIQAQGSGGTIEGLIALSADRSTRTAERYVDDAGVPQDIPQVPVVVRIENPGLSSPAKASGPLDVTQKARQFSPLLLVVPLGARVAFPNGDPFFHNVFSYSKPKRFDLGRYRQGE